MGLIGLQPWLYRLQRSRSIIIFLPRYFVKSIYTQTKMKRKYCKNFPKTFIILYKKITKRRFLFHPRPVNLTNYVLYNIQVSKTRLSSWQKAIIIIIVVYLSSSSFSSTLCSTIPLREILHRETHARSHFSSPCERWHTRDAYMLSSNTPQVNI